ncbi:MAG TPA: hypothetical protein VGE42_01860 [Candidatus Dormibacteraeota bacterium]
MTPTSEIAVAVEVGPRRTFASAVDWPGWCRVARGGPDAALEALAAYAPRYARVTERAGIALPASAAGALSVVETVPGTAITDFGAPNVVTASDRLPLDAGGAARLVALLGAGWAELDAVAAGAPAQLRKGPRGGGRDRDAVVEHVVEAERSYARKAGVRLTATEWREGHVALLRARLGEALCRTSDGTPPVERGWPPRYLLRRGAWHVLDHAWEIEDRSR